MSNCRLPTFTTIASNIANLFMAGNSDIRAILPDLGSLLAVPTPAEYILTRREVIRDLHMIRNDTNDPVRRALPHAISIASTKIVIAMIMKASCVLTSFRLRARTRHQARDVVCVTALGMQGIQAKDDRACLGQGMLRGCATLACCPKFEEWDFVPTWIL